MVNACIFLLGVLAHISIAMTFTVFTRKPNKRQRKHRKSLTIEQGRVLPSGEKQYIKQTIQESLDLPESDLLDINSLDRLLK